MQPLHVLVEPRLVLVEMNVRWALAPTTSGRELCELTMFDRHFSSVLACVCVRCFILFFRFDIHGIDQHAAGRASCFASFRHLLVLQFIFPSLRPGGSTPNTAALYNVALPRKPSRLAHYPCGIFQQPCCLHILLAQLCLNDTLVLRPADLQSILL